MITFGDNRINKNKTIFYSTHNFQEAQIHSDRIVVLFNGYWNYLS